jgi:glycosyltransferase involved in cell wall biosynthesis
MSAATGRRLKVCFVVPSLAGGGAERVAVQVLNALDATRWDRSMFLFERSGPYLADLSPSIRLEAPAGTASPGRLARWNALRRFIRRARPDVIVAFLSYLSVLTAARAAGVGAKVVFAVGTPMSAFLSDADYRWSRPWNRWLLSTAMRIGCTVTDLVLATSQGVADDLIASFHGQSARVRVVNNPVDLAAVAAAAGEPLDAHDAAQWHRPVVVAAGRLADVKNYPLLIDAFAILRQRTPASLFVLGEGDREPALRQRIHERGLDDCVHLCGFRANPWSYIARADVFALTSRYEGFGNVIVEAMACGVPVVATSSPGTREILTSGATGLLVEAHEPAAFAAALSAVVTDDVLRREMADRARRHAERYRTESIALAYDRVLTEALA